MDLSQFSRKITTVVADLAEGVTRTVRRAALAADQAVVMSTPVDTGRARANWVVAVNDPVREEVPTPSSPASGASEALEQGREAIAGYGEPGHASIHISNNLPYIGRLNDGSSTQAPAGFVGEAVLAAVAAVRGARVLGSEGPAT